MDHNLRPFRHNFTQIFRRHSDLNDCEPQNMKSSHTQCNANVIMNSFKPQIFSRHRIWLTVSRAWIKSHNHLRPIRGIISPKYSADIKIWITVNHKTWNQAINNAKLMNSFKPQIFSWHHIWVTVSRTWIKSHNHLRPIRRNYTQIFCRHSDLNYIYSLPQNMKSSHTQCNANEQLHTQNIPQTPRFSLNNMGTYVSHPIIIQNNK